MAKPAEKLAESLEVLHRLQARGLDAIQSKDLTRTHRERLLKSGFLKEVIRGWYVPARPDETSGESTAWYALYWNFCASYFQSRFGNDWCIAPEQSLCLYAENWTVPRQLLIRSSIAQNNITELLHGTALLDVRGLVPQGRDIVEKDGLRIFSLPTALVECSPRHYIHAPTDMRAALSMISNASEVLEKLLEGGHSIIAGRLAGAFRNIGRSRIADNIVETMRAAGYKVRENDPFETQIQIALPARERSPYVSRIRLMWQEMREPIIELFPPPPGLPKNIDQYLKRVEDVYVTDAYHSLSIEGYRVSLELIKRVRSGTWNPDDNKNDLEHLNALAARGYWQAHQNVRGSIEKVLHGGNPGNVVDDDHQIWYREMFGPSITAGILKPADLAGYRNNRVHIRRSMYVPPSHEAARDAIPAFFDLLIEEPEAPVRVVLGHFIFVYIHPYMDGNGHMARFLMNTMLASGGYPWTVIPLQERDTYMAALEDASVNQNIKPFTQFLADLVQAGLDGKAPPRLPASSQHTY